MDDAVMMCKNTKSRIRERQKGMGLIEVMTAIIVLTVGLVSLLGVFGMAVASTASAQQDQIAKQVASAAMESIFTARDTANIPFSSIANVGTGTGIFVTSFQPINGAGADGIYGTADDALAQPETFGNAPLTSFQRQIEITPVLDSSNNPIPNLSTITITVHYRLPTGVQKSYVLQNNISSFR